MFVGSSYLKHARVIHQGSSGMTQIKKELRNNLLKHSATLKMYNVFSSTTCGSIQISVML